MLSKQSTLTTAPDHLNSTGRVIKVSADKGRGVYASHFIPRDTTIEISPVRLFDKDKYEKDGKYTIPAFTWSEGQLALASGLGSLFNHADTPNVSYKLDPPTESIRYTTSRDVHPGEELCIFYGNRLWSGSAEGAPSYNADAEKLEDGWSGPTAVGNDEHGPSRISNPYDVGDPDEVIPDEELPFIRFKPPPEEEDLDSIRTVQAWVVDVPEPRHITTLLKWIKKSGLDGPELGHLKRIRKQGDSTSLILSTLPEPPQPPSELNLPAPYLLSVPSSSALTLPSLALKSAFWPTVYTPRRKDEPEPWTRDKLRWAWNAMKKAVDTAQQVQGEELTIAAHIPVPYGIEVDETDPQHSSGLSFSSSDTRKSTNHPLRHASINTIRKMADYWASKPVQSTEPSLYPSNSDIDVPTRGEEKRNGTNYLLTDRAFFVTHEPCIMCSMSLLHSRVKEVIYLYPMPRTGGCGGCVCLPTLKGVNHRYSIYQWRLDKELGYFSERDIMIDETIDA